MKKRLFSILLTLCMALTLLPVPALAADEALTLEAGTYDRDDEGATQITSIAYYGAFSVHATVSGEGAPDLSHVRIEDEPYLGYIGVYDSAGTLLETGRFHDAGPDPDMKYFNAVISTTQLGCGTHTLTVKYFREAQISESAAAAAETTVTITVTRASVTPRIVSYPEEVTFTGEPLPAPTIDQVDYWINGATLREKDTELKEKLYAVSQFVWDHEQSDAPINTGLHTLQMRVGDTDVTTASGLSGVPVPHTVEIKPISSASVTAPMQTFLLETEQDYAIRLADYLEGLSAGENVKFSFIKGKEPWAKSNDNKYIHYWYTFTKGKDGEGVTLSRDGILTISMANVSGADTKADPLFVNVSSSNYMSITMEIPFQWKNARSEEPLAVSMQGWSYGETGGEPQFTQPEGTGTPIVSYTTANGVCLSDKPVNAGNYTVTVRCENDSTAYVGSAVFTIAPKGVTVTGITAVPRVYDGTTTAALSYRGVTITGAPEGSAFTVTATGTFDTKNAGTDKTVTLSNFRLSGAGAANYAVDPETSETTISGTILQRELTVTYDPNKTNVPLCTKTYDGTAVGTAGYVRMEGYADGEDLEFGTDCLAEVTFRDPLLGKMKPVTLCLTLLDTEKANNYSFAGRKRTFTCAGCAGIAPPEMRLQLLYSDTSEKTCTLDLVGLPQGEWIYAVTMTGWVPNAAVNAEMQGNVLHYSVSGAQPGWPAQIEVTASSTVHGDIIQRIWIDLVDRYEPSVRFESDDGMLLKTKENLQRTDKVLDGVPEPTRSGYIFAGWKCGDTSVTADTTYADLAADDTVTSITLTAQWTVCSHSGSTARPNCTAPAVCTVCGGTMAALGHAFTVQEHDADRHWKKCARCDAAEGEMPHTWDNGRITVQPTCTAAGEKVYACTGCSAEKKERLDAKGHDIVSHSAKAVTCGEAGWKAYETCRNCDYSTYAEIAATGEHTYEWRSADGRYWQKCRACGGETAKKGIPVLTITGTDKACRGHDYKFSFTLPAGCRNPVCLSASVHLSVNNGVYNGAVSANDLLGPGTAYTLTVTAETADGFTFRTTKTVTVTDGHEGGTANCRAAAVCEICGDSYGKADAKHHANLVNFPAKAATYTASGSIEYWYCDGCNKYYSDKDASKEITKADTVISRLRDVPSPSQSGGAKSPQTADAGSPALWTVLLFISGGAAVTVGKKKYGR